MTEIEHGGSPEVAAGSEGKDTAPRHVLIREKATEEDQAEAPSPERDSFTARISCSTDSAGSSTTESEHLSGFSGLLEDAITEDHYMELRSAVGACSSFHARDLAPLPFPATCEVSGAAPGHSRR